MAITTRMRKKKQYKKAVLKLRTAIKRGDAEAIRIRREKLQALPKPRQRYAPPLSSREIGDRQPQRMREPHCVERLARTRGRRTEQVAREIEVLLGAERSLQPVAVADHACTETA